MAIQSITVGSSRSAWSRIGASVGRGDRIAAGEQGHVVTHRDQLLGQGIDNALGATVQLWRHRFEKRRDLSNTHEDRPRFILCVQQ